MAGKFYSNPFDLPKTRFGETDPSLLIPATTRVMLGLLLIPNNHERIPLEP
jgi:hypothetical protein